MVDLYAEVMGAIVAVRGWSEQLVHMVPGGGLILKAGKVLLDKWVERQKEDKVRRELQEMLDALEKRQFDRIEAAVKQAFERVNPQEGTEDDFERLRSYLSEMPAAVQSAMKRPDDPKGTTVPATFSLGKVEDVVKLFPATPPRFERGMKLPNAASWELDRRAGQGGFGEVWRVFNTNTRSLCRAVKFGRNADADADLKNERDVIDRLMSKMAANKHPAIVQLQDANFEGIPWLAYEFVEGGDLADLIRGWQKLPPAKRTQEATAKFGELVKAVAVLHELGVVHRDLKPSNILVDKMTGRLRLTDFGISGIAAHSDLRDEAAGTTTRAGKMVSILRGSYTALYASPQQKNGEDPDKRDDVYALGVVGYQMFTGNLDRGTSASSVNALYRVGVTEHLVNLLVRCVEDDPDNRPSDANQLVSELQSTDVAEPPLELVVEPIIAPPRAGRVAAAPQVPPGVLPQLPDDILELEGKVLSLERAVQELAEGTHPDLHQSSRALAAHSVTPAQLVTRLHPLIQKNPQAAVADWCRALPEIPPQLLTPVIAAVQQRIKLQRELESDVAELQRLQRNDFFGLIERFLTPRAEVPFPLALWDRLWAQFRARRYRFVATDLDLLHAAQQRYTDRQAEEVCWSVTANSNEVQPLSAYLEKYPAGKYVAEARERLRVAEEQATTARTTQIKKQEAEQQAARENEAADLRKRLLNDLSDRSLRRRYLNIRTERLKALDGKPTVWFWWLLMPVTCIVLGVVACSTILDPSNPDPATRVWSAVKAAAAMGFIFGAQVIVYAFVCHKLDEDDLKSGWKLVLLVSCAFTLSAAICGWIVALFSSPVVGALSGGGLGALLLLIIIFIINRSTASDDDGFWEHFFSHAPIWIRTSIVYTMAIVVGTLISMAVSMLSMPPLALSFVFTLFLILSCIVADLIYRRNRFLVRRELGPLPWYVDSNLKELRDDYL